jgi:methionyl-tRNA formyltransferase
MKETGGNLAMSTVTLIERGEARPRKQPPAAGRPAPKLSREDGRIDWTLSARAVHNQVRGVTPSPGAFIESRMGSVKILRTQVVDEATPGKPGQILACSTSEGIIVSCGRGSVRIVEMQPPGKRVVSSGSFVCGHRVKEGMTVRDII